MPWGFRYPVGARGLGYAMGFRNPVGARGLGRYAMGLGVLLEPGGWDMPWDLGILLEPGAVVVTGSNSRPPHVAQVLCCRQESSVLSLGGGTNTRVIKDG